MNLAKWHDITRPLRSARAIAPDCFHGRVGFGPKKPLFDRIKRQHEVHYSAAFTAFFFLTSLRLFWLFAI